MVLDRDRALREVSALIAEAHARGDAAVVRISGPPGIGKTTFLRYVLEYFPPVGRALVTSAEPSAQTRHGECIKSLLNGVASVNANEEELVKLMDDVLPEKGSLCVDDAQWLDEISKRVISHVVLTRKAPLIVLLCDRRENADDFPSHQSVRLAPLRTAAAEQLVRRTYPHASKAIVSEIVTAGSGNPFSLKFVAQEAARRRVRSADDVDASFDAAVLRRLERCGQSARSIVRHCAFAEPTADLRNIARAVGISVENVAEGLSEAGDLLTIQDLVVMFRHAVIAEAIRRTAGDPVSYYRRLLGSHPRDDERPENVAARLRYARGCGDDSTAASAALHLGRTLVASGSLATALEYLKIALRYAPRPLPVEYAVEYAGALQQLALDEAAAEFLITELRGARTRGDGYAAAHLMTSYCSVALTLERFAELDASWGPVESLARSREPDAVPVLQTARLASYAFAGRLADVEKLSAAISLRWNDYRALAFAASLRGDAESARERLQLYQAGLGTAHGRMAKGDRALDATIGLFSVGVAALRGFEAGLGEQPGSRDYATDTALKLLRLFCDGAWSEADTLLSALAVRSGDEMEPYSVLDVRMLFAALAHRAVFAPERVLRTIRDLIGRGRYRHAVAPARWYWVACSGQGFTVPPDIAEFVASSLATQPMPYLLGGIPLAVALLAPQLGKERCTESIARAAVFTSRWHRAHADLATAILTEDSTDLRTSRDEFSALGAPVFAMFAGVKLPIPRAVDVALARALDFPQRAQRAAEPRAPLTRREREVAELAAQGLSNREIAMKAAMSERTVEVHLTKAFRKLGVRSRSGLAHVLLR
ncbi:MAG: putative LuxR-family transcriptional regulator [Candidatus Eremiobacteraeota bacterium]|nr:putative LuxR-family transcriptional regulator [Candidatus Eremiobacteraeota bacterium]